MNEESKIKTAIRGSLMRARKIFEDRDEAIKKITSLFSEIQDEVNNDVEFETDILSEGLNYVVYGVFARNGKHINNPRKLMLKYSFGKPNAFPMDIDVPSYGVFACSDLSGISDALEEIISIDDFALNIISIAKEDNADPDIPF